MSVEGLVRSDGAWVELLGEVRGHTVLLVDESGGAAADLLRDAGAVVQVRTPASLPGTAPAQADAVVLAAVPLDSGLVLAAASALRPDGVLLLASANADSPLAWWDRIRQRSGAPLERLATMRALATAAGLPPRAEYGLLRSVHVSSTMFDLQRPAAAARVVAGSSTLSTGLRRQVVELLRRGVARGHAVRLVAGTAVLCSAGPLAFEPLTGRIGVLGSDEVKLLYGDPPRYVDKVYTAERTAAAEADALEAVGRVWPGLAPALLERRTPTRNRISWLPGRTLAVDRLPPADGVRWVLDAARVLGELHRRLGTPVGRPGLVHGDYWLGNVLVDPDRRQITGVIDWTDASLGDPTVDLRFLVDEWVTAARLGAHQAADLHAAATVAYEEARGVPPD